ncbi:telomere repeats-binding bouquet formation protein 1 [Mugil cephalus]|uniref:telomere repeats-binding bouquet formation protein 1 n=1 Tax=Mugil cephalus TaxID=48193 RepID=UPI001FB68FD8|nr:telomere repeats-binding bouquet formation protein 1 [Mugil cephalus]
MDKTAVCRRNTTKTDLSLLLECLKFQMKCPDLQKQALLTIHSICEKREDNVDLLRELGGVAFVYNLSKSSIVHSDVKEIALFTLGTLAEANVYCKNSLCRKETFSDLAVLLMKEDTPLTQKRVSVYLLFVLVASNRLGQTFAQNTGCLDILLNLFRTTFPFSAGATLRASNASQTYQLWASVSSALCGCVNNPQNEEAQRICVAAFPIVNMWLQQITLPCTEIFQPICSFIAMTVANNSCVQESFFASGGLETLTLELVRLASAADTSLLSCQLSVIISKTLSACITDNSVLASGLAQYGVVSYLFSLLASPLLDPEDRLSVLLTVGHFTEASEEHQSQVVQCGGLPIIITLLTEDGSEEVRKTATFILQTCKQATMTGVSGLKTKQAEDAEPFVNMEGFRSSARELLRRIDLLEKTQEFEDDQGDTNRPTHTEGQGRLFIPPALPPTLQRKEGITTIPVVKLAPAGRNGNNELQTTRNTNNNEMMNEMKKITSNIQPLEDNTKTIDGAVWCSVCKGTGAIMSSQVWPQERDSEPHAADSHLLKPSLQMRHAKPKEIKCSEELQDTEMSQMVEIPVEERSVSNIRCAGCVLPFEEVNSRTFASLQSSCHHSCDMHKVLQEATERFRIQQYNNTCRKGNTVEYTNLNAGRVPAARPQRSCDNWSTVSLTPLRKRAGKEKFASCNVAGPVLAPLKRQHPPEDRAAVSDTERRGGRNSGQAVDEQTEIGTDTRRKRKDFSREEVVYLLSGVKTYGLSWNTILWSYPFQPGRTNVDLAKKYRRLMKCKAQDGGCA